MKNLFDKEIAKAYDKLITLIENVHGIIQNQTSLAFKKVHGDDEYNYYGYELQLRQDIWVFFGTWTDIWIKTRCPMIISVLDNTVKFENTKKQLQKYFLENEIVLADFGEYMENYCLAFSNELLEDSEASEKTAIIILEVIQLLK